jgi:hypothetical protein
MNSRRRRIVEAGFPLSCALSLLLAGCGGSHVSALPPTAATTTTDSVARAAFQPETPRSADAFVDSVGVNVHLGYYGTAYVSKVTQVKALLTGLGVRHVRDGVYPGQTNVCQAESALASHGIHVDDITTPTLTLDTFKAWQACTGNAADAIESANEYDISHPSSDTNWAGTLVATQQQLYGTFKPNVPGVVVLGPALTSESAYAAVAPLGSYADFGNMHDYFAGRNPGTGGWGGTGAFGTYGSLAYNIAVAAQATGTKPMVATETGYADASSDPYYVPAATKTDYTLRTLLEHWNAGVARTYLYELVDEGGAPFGSYGLADANANPKRVYTALKGLLTHLSDPGPAFSPTSLTYALTAPSSVHHTLLQKRSGTYELLLWIEAPQWDPVTNTVTTVAPVSVSLGFSTAPQSIHRTTFVGGGTTTSVTLTPSTNLKLSIGSSVTLLDITQ